MKFDEDLRNIFPRPSDSKLELMAKSLNENGLIDDLITCKGVLIDGYIRYELCKKLGIPIRYKEMEFESKDDAKFFKIQNQCAQRELTVFQKCEILYPFEGFIAERVEKQRRKAISIYQRNKQTSAELHGSLKRNESSEDTGTAIAKYANTTRRTWYLAKALIENADEEAKELLRTGKIKIYPTYLRLKAGESLIPKATSSEDDVENDDFVSEAEVATATKRCVEPASQSTASTAMQNTTQAGGKAETEPKHKIAERINDDADRTEDNTEVSNTDDDIGFGRESASAVISTQNHGNHSADNAGTGISETDNTHFSKGAAIDAELEAELAAEEKLSASAGSANSDASDEEDWSTDDVDIDHDPYISEIDINDPDTHLPEAVPHYEMPKRNPIPFPLVRQQVQSSIQTMLFELLVGLCGLRDDDLDRRDEILEIVKHGFKKAKKLIERETTNR